MTSRLVEVWESRLGIQEIKGKKHNPVIVQWAADAGHPEIVDDETSWCSLSMCSAAKEAGLPCPPRNINPMAKSWMTWGKGVKLADAKPGDIVVWQRGAPGSWMGHVNCIRNIRERGDKIEARLIGGNQSGLSGGDAVTITNWQDLGKALAIRRGVPPTVKALREAGSTTIRDADNLDRAGTASIGIGMAWTAIKRMFGEFEVPKFADLPESLTWWETVLGACNALLDIVTAHPWLAGFVLVACACFVISRINKTGRVKEHKAGIPIAAEVEAA